MRTALTSGCRRKILDGWHLGFCVLIDLRTPPVTLSTWVFLAKGTDSSITPPEPIFSQLTALIVAAASELSSLSLIAYPANLAIPLTRFAGFACDPSRRPVANDASSRGERIPRRRHSMSSLQDRVALVTGGSRA
jgi:hypothetical protein